MANSEKSLSRSMISLRRTFRQMGRGSRQTAEMLLALRKALEQTAKSGGKLARSLASFDQLNRLASPGGATGKVQELTESFRQLRAETLRPWTVPFLDNLPDFIKGLNGDMQLVGDALLRGKLDLSEHAGLWDLLTVTMKAATDSGSGFRTETVTIRQAMDWVNGTLEQVTTSLGMTDAATGRLKGEMVDLGLCSVTGYTVLVNCWKALAPWFSENVENPMATSISGMFLGFPARAQEAWSATTQVFSQTGSFFETTFSNAWTRVKSVFSNTGPVFEGIKNGVLAGFKVKVNGLIDGINQVIPMPFNGITTALNKLKNIRIGGLFPFAGLRTSVYVPKIPYLAQGAVLPANKPFMAVVGDQRHGTNVEAPLATITEAVAIAMEDLQEGNLAGHRATVELLGRILEAVQRVQITDGDIARANRRYEQKQAIMYGV